MTKTKMKDLLKSAVESTKLVNAHFRFDPNYYNLIPLILGNKLFLSIEEDDFIFDGYIIFRYKDLSKIKIKNDKCDEILEKEGLTHNIEIPDIDITNWMAVFESLNRFNRNIIVEKQSMNKEESEFIIGRIEKIHNHFAYV